MPTIRQTNFSAGELAPQLYGRSDIPKFAQGLRQVQNFFVSKQGALVSRPGTLLVDKAADHFHQGIDFLGAPTYSMTFNGDSSYGKTRLIPFTSGAGVSYVLEFSERAIGFIRNGVRVLGAGVPFFVVTPYLEADLFKIRYAQVGDVLTLCLGGVDSSGGETYVAKQLRHTSSSDNAWDLVDLDMAALDSEGVFVDADDPTGFTSKPELMGVQLEDATHPAREWTWKQTAVMQNEATGEIRETLPETIDTIAYAATGVTTWVAGAAYVVGNKVNVAAFNQFLICITAGTSAAAGSGPYTTTGAVGDGTVVWEPLPYQGYGHFRPAYVLTCLYPDKPATISRDYLNLGLIGAPSWLNEWKTIAFNVYRGRGDLFGFVGQTKTRTFVDNGSEPNYAIQPPVGFNPFRILNGATGALASTERPTALAYFQEKFILAGTTSRPGQLWGSATGDYQNFDKHALIHVPGEALNFELAARKREEILHALGHQALVLLTDASAWTVQGTVGNPLDFDSIDARVVDHIGSTIVPPLIVDDTVLYVRSRGTGIRGLAPSDTGGNYLGSDLSVLAPHLFVGTNREVVDWCYAAEPWGVVWAVREDGVLLSLTFSKENGVLAWARHEFTAGLGPAVAPGETSTPVPTRVESVCSVPEGDEDAVYVVVVREVSSGSLRTVERLSRRVQKQDGFDDQCVDGAVRFVNDGTLTLTGLSHLEGLEVYAAAEGGVIQGPYTVASGSITLEAAMNIGTNLPFAVGVPFTAEFETLDLVESSVRLKQKTVTKVGFEVVTSGPFIEAGQDFDHLIETVAQEVTDGYSLAGLKTQLFQPSIDGTWGTAGRAVLRQSKPLPLMVVGIEREVDIGG